MYTDPDVNAVHDIEYCATKPRTDPNEDNYGIFASESSSSVPVPVSPDDHLLYEPSNAYPAVSNPNTSTHNITTRSQSALHNHGVEFSPGLELTSTEKAAALLHHERFHSKEFLLHEAEGLPTFLTENVYNKEEDNLKRS